MLFYDKSRISLRSDKDSVLYGYDPAAAFGCFGRMGHHKDRLPASAVDITKQVHDFRSGFAVQISCGFIRKEDFRVSDQSAGDGHTLLLASG